MDRPVDLTVLVHMNVVNHPNMLLVECADCRTCYLIPGLGFGDTSPLATPETAIAYVKRMAAYTQRVAKAFRRWHAEAELRAPLDDMPVKGRMH